jgi:dTMP kinase
VSQFLQFLSNNTHLIFVFLILMGGFFSWVSKTLKEQAEAKRARERFERSRLESLRTGRPASTPEITEVVLVEPEVSPAQRRLQEIAERRKRQLDELRARAAARQRGSTPDAEARSPAPPAQTPSGRDADARRREASKRLERQKARQRQAAFEQQSSQRDREEAERREMLARAAQTARRETAANQDAQVAAIRESGYSAAPAAPLAPRAPLANSRKPASLGLLLGRMSRDDLRKAIILQEVFGTPVGSRSPNEIGVRP